MEHFFLDTSFIIARFSPKDVNHKRALDVAKDHSTGIQGPVRWILSDYIFDESVTTVLGLTRRWDQAQIVGAALLGSGALSMSRVDEAAFDAAWTLFQSRKDKLWSFTDCTSFVLMNRLGIRKALTFDRNFSEAGFATIP